MGANAQAVGATGPQQLVFAGLRVAAVSNGIPAGQIEGVATNSKGEIVLLLDAHDGVRLLKLDAAAENVLAEAHLGAAGDAGVAMTLDPAGAVYVTGTASSGLVTSTAGAAFSEIGSSGNNAFVARFDSNLNSEIVTSLGATSASPTAVAASADAVFVTGVIFSDSLPVTPSAWLKAPGSGTRENGFVERFSADGSILQYATYLTGAGGVTSPAAITADSSDGVYVAGYTSAPSFPTRSALVPEMIGSVSGFVTYIARAGDRVAFSTFVPGGGLTSAAFDANSGTVLLSGDVSAGSFPISAMQIPVAGTPYQSLVRMAADGSSLLSATALAPGAESFVVADANGGAWVAGNLSTPLFPLAPLQGFGDSFAMHVNSSGVVDQTARFGGLPADGTANAAAPVNLTSIALSPGGDALVGGAFAPTGTSNPNAYLTFDLPLTVAQPAFADSAHAALLPSTACTGSTCAGSAAYLARMATAPSTNAEIRPSFALSVDDAPQITVRNLATVQTTGVQIKAAGFAEADNCGSVLPAGGECAIVLSGTGPGSVTVSAANAATQSAPIPALSSAAAVPDVVFSPKELDFGVVSAMGAPVLRTITVTNLSGGPRTFLSEWSASSRLQLPYVFSEVSTDCTLAGANTRLLQPGSSCHITLSLTPSTNSADDGSVSSAWMLGSRSVRLRTYELAEALSLSAREIDFGRQDAGGLQLPRYLYVANESATSYTHHPIAFAGGSPFTAVDGCPSSFVPGTVCRIELEYRNSQAASADSDTLTLDDGETVLVKGHSGAPASLSLSTASLAFSSESVMGVSESRTILLTNGGGSAARLTVTFTGADFSETDDCDGELAAGASCSVVVTFAPSAPGIRNGVLTVSAQPGIAAQSVTLSGTGIDVLSPSANGVIDFGAIPVNDSAMQWFKMSQSFPALTVIATGSFSAVLVPDNGQGHGSPAASALSSSVAGECSNCWLGVQFAATAEGDASGTLTLRAGSALAYTVVLRGSGQAVTDSPTMGQAELIVSPGGLNFGFVATGGRVALPLTLTNSGTGPARGISLAVTGPYTVTTLCNSPVLAAGASCSIAVTFSPGAVGSAPGTLAVSSADLVSPLRISLNGSGVVAGLPFSFASSSGTSLSASVKSGGSTSVDLDLMPLVGFAGDVSVSCAAISDPAYGPCSVTPAILTLNGASRTVTVAIRPQSTVAGGGGQEGGGRSFGETALALLFPALFFSWKAQTSERAAWRRGVPILWAVFAAAALLTSSGCSAAAIAPAVQPGPPAVYQYRVTAKAAGTESTQTVMLNLTVSP